MPPAAIAGAGLVANIAGSRSAERASRRAQQASIAQQQAAIESQERAEERALELARPFAEFGTAQLDPLAQAIGAQAPDQFAAIQQSPLFQAALNQADRQDINQLANRGLIGTGLEDVLVGENLLLAAQPLIAQQQQREIDNLFRATALGQAAAAGQAANIGQTAANVGNIQQNIGQTAAGGIANRAGIRGGALAQGLSFLPGILGGLGGATPPPTVGVVADPNAFGGFA